MTRGHRLTIEITDAPDGDGFHVDASCGCGFPNRTGGHGWTWGGWNADPARGAGAATAEWQEHLVDVGRRFGHLAEHYRQAGA